MSVKRSAVVTSLVISAFQAWFVWQLLANTKPYKIMPNAAAYETVAQVAGLLGLALAVFLAVVISRRRPSLAPLASSVVVPAGAVVAFLLAFGTAPDPPQTPFDFSPTTARRAFVRSLTPVALSSIAVSAFVSLLLAADQRRLSRAASTSAVK